MLEYLHYLIKLNSFDIWNESDAYPSELTSYRRFIPILELLMTDTDVSIKNNEQKSTSTAKHMEWNEELFLRKTSDQNGYSFGRKIDFILKDSNNNELNAGEFKQKNVSEAVKISQQVKNVRDNAAILIENKKLAGGDHFKDAITILPFSKLIASHNVASLKQLGLTLNSLYYLKSQLIKLSDDADPLGTVGSYFLVVVPVSINAI